MQQAVSDDTQWGWVSERRREKQTKKDDADGGKQLCGRGLQSSSPEVGQPKMQNVRAHPVCGVVFGVTSKHARSI